MTIAYGFGFDFARPRSRRGAHCSDRRTCDPPRLPGTGVRFGLDALVGLLPAVGDIITTVLSLFIVHEATSSAPGSHPPAYARQCRRGRPTRRGASFW
jgi:hypothetical protein